MTQACPPVSFFPAGIGENLQRPCCPPLHFPRGVHAKWHAAQCPGFISRNSGSSIAQISNCAMGQRVWKRQPEGGFNGLGTSPLSTIRVRLILGSGIGMADINALVYG